LHRRPSPLPVAHSGDQGFNARRAGSQRLAFKWERRISQPAGVEAFDILPDLTALALDVIGAAALGRALRALEGGATDFLEAFEYILAQSKRPVHALTTWWKDLPIPSSRRLCRAFRVIDESLDNLIRESRERGPDDRPTRNLMDCLLSATSGSGDNKPLTCREMRDNLLAILANGHQTVAICLALTLYLLARNPNALEKARAEVDEYGLESVSQLHCLEAAIIECLRFYPAAVGLQRELLSKTMWVAGRFRPGGPLGSR
jgi:cytochrome P450